MDAFAGSRRDLSCEPADSSSPKHIKSCGRIPNIIEVPRNAYSLFPSYTQGVFQTL